MVKVAVIVGSTRPGRKALDVARWVMETAVKRSDASFELVDLQDFNLPLLDEPVPPAMDQYSKPHTIAWAEKIAECHDGQEPPRSGQGAVGTIGPFLLPGE